MEYTISRLAALFLSPAPVRFIRLYNCVFEMVRTNALLCYFAIIWGISFTAEVFPTSEALYYIEPILSLLYLAEPQFKPKSDLKDFALVGRCKPG